MKPPRSAWQFWSAQEAQRECKGNCPAADAIARKRAKCKLCKLARAKTLHSSVSSSIASFVFLNTSAFELFLSPNIVTNHRVSADLRIGKPQFLLGSTA